MFNGENESDVIGDGVEVVLVDEERDGERENVRSGAEGRDVSKRWTAQCEVETAKIVRLK